MNRKLLGALAALLAVVAAAYVGSPFWAALQFKNAAISGDRDALDAAVDFPAVREGLKGQLMAAFTIRMQNDPQLRGNPFAGLGMMMAPALVGRMVDALVTADGLSAIVKQGKVARGGSSSDAPRKVDYRYDYRGLDRFAVTVSGPDTKPGEAPVFVFDRRGLFSWKLIRLELPEKMLAGTR